MTFALKTPLKPSRLGSYAGDIQNLRDGRRRRKQKIKKVYLAGPMSNIDGFNFDAFRSASARLRAAGFEVINPAELDDPEEIATYDPHDFPQRAWRDCLARDLRLVCQVDAVVVLSGWQRSRGARLETYVARELGKPVMTYPSLSDARRPPETDQ